MMAKGKGVTLMVHRDGALESKAYRFPLWAFYLLKWGGIALGVLIVVAAAVFTPIARTAARVPGLTSEIERLREENSQVRELAASLSRLEAAYAQVRTMLGSERVPENPSEPRIPMARPVIAAVPGVEGGAAVLLRWPLDQRGFVTRGFVGEGQGSEFHPGLDVAVSMETPIRASAEGVVLEAGIDREYGTYVLIDHPNGYQTMYGHASRALVATGDSVVAGEVIGLTGSTGRSTAPHLHFEVRMAGQSVDPEEFFGEAQR